VSSAGAAALLPLSLEQFELKMHQQLIRRYNCWDMEKFK